MLSIHVNLSLNASAGTLRRWVSPWRPPAFLSLKSHSRFMRTALSTLDFEPMLRVDAELSLAQLTPKFYQQIQKLAPFGYGNPLPVLASRVDLVEKPRILKEKHLRIRVEEAGCRMDAIGWGMANKAELLAPGKSVEIAYTLMEDDFGGKTRLQLVLRDLRWGSESPDNQDAENRRWDGGQ